MASRNTVDSKRFIYRSPGKKIIAYVRPVNKSRSHVTSKPLHSQMMPPLITETSTPSPQRLVNIDTPRAELTETKRIVVTRSNKPQTTPRSVDSSDLVQQDPVKLPLTSSNAESGFNISRKYSPPVVIRPTDMITSRTALSTSPRRVVVVRNPRNPQVDQGPVYVEELRRSDTIDRPPVITDGNKQVILMRRPPVVYEPPRIRSPLRSSPIIIQTRPRSRSPSPIRTYHSQPPITVVQHAAPRHGDGCFPWCFSSDDTEPSGVMVDNSYGKGDPWRTSGQYPPYGRTGQVHNNTHYQSSDAYARGPCWQRLLSLLSRYLSFVVIATLLVLLIAIGCIIICAVFLALDSVDNTGLKIVGIIIGTILALGIMAFLFFLLCCLGQRDGFFSYFGKRSRIGGQGYAIIAPTHPYGPDYPPSRPSNVVYNQPAIMAPITNGYENNQNKHNIIIEMPETPAGTQLSPESRERSMNKVAKNINQIVDDARRRNNGDVPNTVIVKVD